MNNITKISEAEFYAVWEDLDFFCHALNMCNKYYDRKKRAEEDEEFRRSCDPDKKAVRSEDDD